MIETASGISLKIKALNTVAAIGSTTLKAEAMPAGKCFIDHVNKKYGITNVTIPKQTHRGSVGSTAPLIFTINPMGSQTDNEIILINMKLYSVTVTVFRFFFIETFVNMLYAAYIQLVKTPSKIPTTLNFKPVITPETRQQPNNINISDINCSQFVAFVRS